MQDARDLFAAWDSTVTRRDVAGPPKSGVPKRGGAGFFFAEKRGAKQKDGGQKNARLFWILDDFIVPKTRSLRFPTVLREFLCYCNQFDQLSRDFPGLDACFQVKSHDTLSSERRRRTFLVSDFRTTVLKGPNRPEIDLS